MRNKKGFTLVELVIVIAVIAILAGVMIAVFANVVKDAQESAKLQELKSQEIAQKADDILEKMGNTDWMGWEDFEVKLADSVSKAVKESAPNDLTGAITMAVDEAIAKYAVTAGQENTALTAEQVKTIVAAAVKENSSYTGVTEAQVRSIVNSATAGTSTLTRAQVETIVSNVVTAAQSKSLTIAQVTGAVQTIVTAEAANQTANIDAAVQRAIRDYKTSTLTEEQISNIVAKYFVGSNVKGDYTWYDPSSEEKTVTIDTEEKLLALPAVVNAGDSMKGKTITLKENTTYDFADEAWTPIGSNAKNLFQGEIKGASDTERTTIKLSSKDYAGEWFTTASTLSSGFAWGLIGYCDKDVTFENINLVVDCDIENGLCVGGFIGYVLGESKVNGISGESVAKTISFKNCSVTGSIKTSGKTGGFIGNAYGFDGGAKVNLIFDNCVSDVDISLYGERSGGALKTLSRGSGFIGYTSNSNTTATGCTFTGTCVAATGTTLWGGTFGLFGGGTTVEIDSTSIATVGNTSINVDGTTTHD